MKTILPTGSQRVFTDEDIDLLNKLLKTPIEDTQFYRGYPDRCKAYAKALKALLVRLEAAENYIERLTPRN